MSRQHPRNRSNPLYRPLAIAALVMGGTLQLIAPALAGNLDIVNKATATYTDGTPGGQTYQATSNTVTISVQEVAGITITAAPPSNPSPKAGDKLYVDFTITNTGFDPTQFVVPNAATLSDSTNFKINGPLLFMSFNGQDLNGGAGVAVNDPIVGNATGPVPVGQTVVVRVPIEVLGSATTANTLTVSLGETDPVNSNNLVRVDGTKDVFTLDNADTVAGEFPGAPVDTREAMATSSTITVAARYQAFASVLKANGAFDNNSTPNLLSDDKLTYKLALKVDSSLPSSASNTLAPSDLYGTAISVDGSAVNRVLVSDAVPTGTQLGATADIVAPSANWQIVYTTELVAAKTALAAAWTTTRPTTGVITRVGFVYNTDATNAAPVGNGPIAKGTTVSGFSFKVNPLATFTGGQIANIAQVFGQSQPGTPSPNTATQIVYDESGDQDTNNKLIDANPAGVGDSSGGINDGLGNTTRDGIDPGTGTNPTAADTNTGVDTGSDLGGETTVYTVAATPFTGPDQAPEAAGPGSDPDKNKDYTNLSIALDPGLNPTTLLEDAKTGDLVFKNSVKNVSGAPQVIALRPSLPATFGTNEAALPTNSTVTIDPDGATGPIAPVVFTYDGAKFTTTGAVPTVTVGAGLTQDYTVTINPHDNASQLKGYPVIVSAFIDGDSNGLVGASEPSNQTIDSYYTGYVKLEKDAQIMDGATIKVPYTTVSADLSAEAKPGRIIKYRIKYTNISVGNEAANTGNKSLSANALTITEDGTAGGNTWFTSTVDNVAPVTSGNGSLVVPTLTPAATVTLTKATNGTVTNDIQVYTIDLGIVAPGGTGDVIFDRKIK
jgi:hypothetical protein